MKSGKRRNWMVIKGLILGRPYDNKFVDDYNNILLQVVREEQGDDQLPIITEMDFGHTCPTFTIPYGVLAEIDNEQKHFAFWKVECLNEKKNYH